MKLLFPWYFPFQHGGVETFLLNITREMVRRGHSVWIASTKTHTGPFRAEFENAGAHLLDWSLFHSGFYGDRTASQFVQQQIISDLAKIRPDVLMLNDCLEFAIGATPLIRTLRKVCSIVDTLHTNQPLRGYITVRHTYARSVDGWIATSQHVADRVRTHFPNFPRDYIRYIPYGINYVKRTRDSRKSPQLRILFVSRLVQNQKRVRDLPEIVAALCRRNVTFTLTIVGDGPERKELESQFKRMNMYSRVRFRGALLPEETRQEYFCHDVMINLAEYETGPITAIEAMQAGCIPVCTEIPSIARDTIRPGVNGYLCPVGDIDAFANVLTELQDRNLLELQLNAQRTGQDFSVERMGSRYFEFLHQLREKRNPSPWPEDSSRLWRRLRHGWDLSKRNPWIPHPHPLRQLFNRIIGQT